MRARNKNFNDVQGMQRRIAQLLPNCIFGVLVFFLPPITLRLRLFADFLGLRTSKTRSRQFKNVAKSSSMLSNDELPYRLDGVREAGRHCRQS